MAKIRNPTSFLDNLDLKIGIKSNTVKFDPDEIGVTDSESPVKATTINLSKRLVVIECPWDPANATGLRHQERYAEFCVLDSIRLGEAPYLGYQVLNKILNNRMTYDHDPAFFCHVNWIPVADILAVYIDHGITPSMQMSINVAKRHTTRIEYRIVNKL